MISRNSSQKIKKLKLPHCESHKKEPNKLKVHNTWTQSRVKQTHFFHVMSIITSHGLNSSLRSFFSKVYVSQDLQSLWKDLMKVSGHPLQHSKGVINFFLKSLKLNLIKTYLLIRSLHKGMNKDFTKIGIFFFSKMLIFFLLFSRSPWRRAHT